MNTESISAMNHRVLQIVDKIHSSLVQWLSGCLSELLQSSLRFIPIIFSRVCLSESFISLGWL